MKGHVFKIFMLFLPHFALAVSFGESGTVPAGDSCSIRLSFPLDYQTFQRDVNNSANIPVRGYCSCIGDVVEASWNDGPFRAIDSVGTDNYFEGILPFCSVGQGSLIIRCVSSPECLTKAEFVGVGDVFVIAGQSNASGRANRLNRYHHQTLRASVFSGTGNWREANDPLHTQDKKTRGSVWPLLASLIMEDQNVPVAFIATAMGGTGLVANGHWSPPDGSRYRNMIELVKSSGVNAVRSVLFFQGERDVSHHVPEDQYFRSLSQFARITADTLPGHPIILIGQTGQYAPKSGFPNAIDAIRHAQSRVWDSMENVFPGPVTFDLAPLSDGIHFMEDNHMRILADRWWASIRSTLYGVGNGRGPKGVATFRMPDMQSLMVLFKHGAAQMESQNPAAGFQVFDGNREVPIVDAAIRNPDTVFLFLESPLQSMEVHLNYGSGNRPGRLYASGDIPLPAEPFTRMRVSLPHPIPSVATETEEEGTLTRKEKRKIRRANRSDRHR